MNDSEFGLFFGWRCGLYTSSWQSPRNLEPQVVIDHDGIRLGFGRNRFHWTNSGGLRRLRCAATQIGLDDQAFIAPPAIDVGLRRQHAAVRGQPTTVLCARQRPTQASAMLTPVGPSGRISSNVNIDRRLDMWRFIVGLMATVGHPDPAHARRLRRIHVRTLHKQGVPQNVLMSSTCEKCVGNDRRRFAGR